MTSLRSPGPFDLSALCLRGWLFHRTAHLTFARFHRSSGLAYPCRKTCRGRDGIVSYPGIPEIQEQTFPDDRNLPLKAQCSKVCCTSTNKPVTRERGSWWSVLMIHSHQWFPNFLTEMHNRKYVFTSWYVSIHNY